MKRMFSILVVVFLSAPSVVPTTSAAEIWRNALASAERRYPIEDAVPTDRVLACCRICTQGKACGDTCIARDKICHVGPGCACDG